MTLESLALQGREKTHGSLASSVISNIYQLRKELIRESMSDFREREHRMEYVANVHGIEFINDSGACTINSTWFSLENMNNPCIWITGGSDRETDYSELKELAKGKVKAIISLCPENTKILETFGDTEIPVIRARNMEEAVESAYYLGKKGDIVLLSPACASFRMFENYEERGKAFREVVKKL